MPRVAISVEAMGLLIKEARARGTTIKDVLDEIVLSFFAEEEVEEEGKEDLEED